MIPPLPLILAWYIHVHKRLRSKTELQTDKYITQELTEQPLKPLEAPESIIEREGIRPYIENRHSTGLNTLIGVKIK